MELYSKATIEKPIQVMAKLEEGDVMSDGLHRGEWLILLPLVSEVATY